MIPSQKEILYLLHLPPPIHGSSIVGEQVKESRLINDTFRGRYVNLILSRKVNESGRANFVKTARFVKIWFQLLYKLIHRRPHLCYYALTTTGACFRKDVILIALLRFFRIKIIYHIHNKGIVKARKHRMNRSLYPFVFKNASVILLSKHLYYDVEAYVPESNVFYCPNGIRDYLPRMAYLTLPEYKPFRILFFSNLIEEKGVFVLVEACSILKEKGYHFQCDFVGGEGDVSVNELISFIKHKELTDRVRYIGKRYGKLKEMVFEEADVFVLPSRCDCFPLVILEAMQHRLPVVTAHEGGMPDMVDEGITGYLIPTYDDAQVLSERLEYLLLNPVLRAEMGLNGRKKYENHFTLPIFEQRLLCILQEVIHQ